jgi:hypothetical protein
MAKTSLERRASRGATRARPRDPRSHRVALLIGTGLFLHAGPAWAVNECGPPPPGGGTVTCPPGTYPGIRYVTPSNLEIVLQPGVRTFGDSRIDSAGDVRLLGPVDTILRTTNSGSVVLWIETSGSILADLDRIVPELGSSAGQIITTNGSISFTANSISSPWANRLLILSTGGGSVSVDVDVFSIGEAIGSALEVAAYFGDAHVDVGVLRTSGDRSTALDAFARGSLTINSREIISAAGLEAAAIQALSYGTITIQARDIRTSGVSSPGIDAFAVNGITIVTQLVETTGAGSSTGIIVSGGGKVDITSGIVRVKAHSVRNTDSRGIVAFSRNGDVIINSGSVITEPDRSTAIQANARGNVRIVSGSIETNGSGSIGISSSNVAGGPVTVSSGTITTRGADAPAIDIYSVNNVEVTSGTITTSGARSPGIIATSFGGTVKINSGTITTGVVDAPGIWASGGRSVEVTAGNVNATGLRSDAIRMQGGTQSTVTISGLVRAQDGFALRADGGPSTANLLSGATLRGRVSLTGGADRINNSGTFDAIGTSQFGAGADLFENNAGGTVQSVNGAATFAGLETFNNRGIIDMRDGATNDTLALSTYSGSAGGRLGLDVDFTTRTADRLITGAATGSTSIEIRHVGVGTLATSGILLVDAGAGTSPTAFVLAPGTDNAYLRSILRFDAANNDFLLDRTVGGAAFETARFGAMASHLWQESADAVAAQLDTQRDGRRGRGIALWLQGWTGERERSGSQTLAGAGTFDVSFEQDFQGLQGGLDFQSGSGVVGITGGAARSDAAFAATGNPVDMKVRNVGLYAQVRAGPLSFNALAKHDWAELEIAPGAGLDSEFDADLFGVQANAALRLGSGALFAEPSVGLSWVKADLDSFESGPAAVDPGGVDSVRARAGLRVGARVPLGGGDLLPFVAANVYEELGGRSETEFTLGETLRLFDEQAGTRGQAAAGLSFVTAGFEAFVRGEMDFSGGADARAVRAGARLRF